MKLREVGLVLNQQALIATRKERNEGSWSEERQRLSPSPIIIRRNDELGTVKKHRGGEGP